MSRTSCYPLLRSPPSWHLGQPVATLENPERWLLSDDWRSPSLLARARAGIADLVSARVGGDCWAPDGNAAQLGPPNGAAIVVLPDKRDPGAPP